MFFLLLYGKKEVTKTVGSGSFCCPQCGSEQPYWQKTWQEKGHLYFINVLSLGEKTEFVQCRTCESLFDSGVLSFKPDEANAYFRSQFDVFLCRLMVLMILADGKVEDSEIEMLIAVFEGITGQTLTRDEVLAEVDVVATAELTVADYTGAMGQMLTDEAKAMILEAVFLIAAADDTLDPAESDTVTEIANGLNMSDSQVQAALAPSEEDPARA